MTGQDYVELVLLAAFGMSLSRGLFGKDRDRRVEQLLTASVMVLVFIGGKMNELVALMEGLQ